MIMQIKKWSKNISKLYANSLSNKLSAEIAKICANNYGRMLKAPLLISSDLDISVLSCNCQTNDDNIGQKFQKRALLFSGKSFLASPPYMFKNEVYWYRTKVCPAIGKIIHVMA